jgi:hypothetical protein
MSAAQIQWDYFPRSDRAPSHLTEIVSVFARHLPRIASASYELTSNEVLAVVRQDLQSLGFRVEEGRRNADGIRVPVLFGRNGSVVKAFRADAFDETSGTVLEVEAGRGFTNYQFLKDLFQACAMHGVDYLGIVLRNVYRRHRDFDAVTDFFDTLYASRRLVLPLKGVLLIGY